MKIVQSVPCNGCFLCCKGDAIRIMPEDEQYHFESEPHPYYPGKRMIAHKSNGECFYLSEPIYPILSRGCLIHENKPQQCREFDCRNIAKQFSWTQARKLDRDGLLKLAVWKRGKELLRKKKSPVIETGPNSFIKK